MENLFGKITASLIDSDRSFPTELVDIINSNISPPEKITEDNIYIRAMYIVSDQVNSYGGRFPENEFERLMNLLIDSPVLIGHRKDSLPIARNFHAEQKQKGDTNWIKVYFYWLKNAKGAETLKNNIDGGIYKECSISFVFSLPECSICGDDIRRCGHRPFKEYQTSDGTKSEAYFDYRQIDKVLETSIVYRGSVHDTSLTNELFFPVSQLSDNYNKSTISILPAINRIWSTDRLDPTHEYQIKPAYESLRVIIEKDKKNLTACYCTGAKIACNNLEDYLGKLDWPEGKYSLDCRLIGYRGKERQKLNELSKYLNGNKSKVTRLEIKVYDICKADNFEKLANLLPVSLVSSEKVSFDNLNKTVESLVTRYGVEIVDFTTGDNFLLTNKKTAVFEIVTKNLLLGGYKYGLSGKIGQIKIDCTTFLTSGKNYPVGYLLEIEMSSFKCTENNFELISPKIVDSTGQGTINENLEFLIENNVASISIPTYSISKFHNSDLLLSITDNNEKKDYLIYNFDPVELSNKKRFLTDQYDNEINQTGSLLGSGEILNSEISGASEVFDLNGYLSGTYIIRPIVLNRVDRFLFYQIPNLSTSEASCVQKQ